MYTTTQPQQRAVHSTYLIARYMGRMANRGKVWTFIMMVMKAMYRRTLMKPAKNISSVTDTQPERNLKRFKRIIIIISTCEEFCVEHIDSLVVPGILTLQVNSVQDVLDEGCQDHGQQDGILKK